MAEIFGPKATLFARYSNFFLVLKRAKVDFRRKKMNLLKASENINDSKKVNELPIAWDKSGYIFNTS